MSETISVEHELFSDAERHDRALPVAYVPQSVIDSLCRGFSGLYEMSNKPAPGHRPDCTVPLYAAPSPPAAVQEPVAVKALRDIIVAGIKDQGYGYTLKGDKLTVSSDEVFAVDIAKLAAFIRSAISTSQSDPTPEIAALPQDVINLVIAAREAFDTGFLEDQEINALDKALEPFSSRVPYENEPDAAAPEQEGEKW